MTDQDGDAKMEAKKRKAEVMLGSPRKEEARIGALKRVRTKAPDAILSAAKITPDSFEAGAHFYPRVLNATVHPMVHSFMSLGLERIAERYCHLHPKTDKDYLLSVLRTPAKFFRWSGADLVNVTNVKGERQMCLLESASCPSGQKSMPGQNEEANDGYHRIMKDTFLPAVKEAAEAKRLVEGGLAVIYDKNPIEAKGYAAALADEAKEEVWIAELYEDDTSPPVRFEDGVMSVRDAAGAWHPIRACFRFVTQRPWTRIPINTRTLILNPIVACLAGGRNKMAADKAYEIFNGEIAATELRVRTPETIRDVAKAEVPMWVTSMGGKAVIKVPYSNSGKGVYTILSEDDLKRFMDIPQRYPKYILQSLIGNSTWFGNTDASASRLFHTGTLPDKKGEIFVADLRMMVQCTASGYVPVSVYARRSAEPLRKELKGDEDSWGMLGTSLSVRAPDGTWSTDTNRLLLMDVKDFNKLGLAIDDLVDAFVQCVLATTAIDRMAQRLMAKGTFDFDLYNSLNADQILSQEIMRTQGGSEPAATS